MKRFTITLISLLTGLLPACTSEEDGTALGPDTGNVITFSLISSEKQDDETRAPGEPGRNENRIDRLEIFFFDGEGQCLFYPGFSQITKTDTKITVNVPSDIASTLFNTEPTLYLLANCNKERSQLEGKRKSEIEAMVYETSPTLNPDQYENQSNFLMEGEVQLPLLAEDVSDLGEITLYRAAAKITVRITNATVDGYTAVDAKVRLNNYLDKTVIGGKAGTYMPASADEYRNSGFRDLYIPNNGGTGFTTGPFYSYATDWELTSANESYITIAVNWHHDSSGLQKVYYYRVPFTYMANNPPGAKNNRLQRNHIYDLAVDISELGGLDPALMVDLSPNIIVKDWTTEIVTAEIGIYDYLFISELFVDMHETDYREIGYISSKPISLNDISAHYLKYGVDAAGNGTITEVPITSGEMYPLISVDVNRNVIIVESVTPINYVPKHISFRVRNEANLTQKVVVTQYPRQYITSEFSKKSDLGSPPLGGGWSNNGDGRDGMKNFNLYHVTTTNLALSDTFVIGDPTNIFQPDFIDADEFGIITGRRVTRLDAEANNMISPNFIIASQRGITSVETTNMNARRRCATYSEGGYPVGTWRVPTLAELMLISALQIDNNSAIKNLFTPISSGDQWWSAYIANHSDNQGFDSYSVRVAEGISVLNTHRYVNGYDNMPKSSVRCIHDVWRTL